MQGCMAWNIAIFGRSFNSKHIFFIFLLTSQGGWWTLSLIWPVHCEDLVNSSRCRQWGFLGASVAWRVIAQPTSKQAVPFLQEVNTWRYHYYNHHCAARQGDMLQSSLTSTSNKDLYAIYRKNISTWKKFSRVFIICLRNPEIWNSPLTPRHRPV